jgi:hypothetical protein
MFEPLARGRNLREGHDNKVVTTAYLTHGFELAGMTASAMIFGSTHIWAKAPRYERWFQISEKYVKINIWE